MLETVAQINSIGFIWYSKKAERKAVTTDIICTS